MEIGMKDSKEDVVEDPIMFLLIYLFISEVEWRPTKIAKYQRKYPNNIYIGVFLFWNQDCEKYGLLSYVIKFWREQ